MVDDAGKLMTDQFLGQMEEDVSTAYAEETSEAIAELVNFIFTLDDINDVREIYKFFHEQNKLRKQMLKEGKISQKEYDKWASKIPSLDNPTKLPNKALPLPSKDLIEQNKVKRQLLTDGKISQKEYNKWKANALAKDQGYLNMQKKLTEDLTRCHEKTISMIDGGQNEVYSINRNYGTYEVEGKIGASTSYTLYDKDTVRRLREKKSDLLPTYKLNNGKDAAWNAKHIRQAITAGILKGDEIPTIAEKLEKAINMSKNSAIKTARTATTCAQNSGRIDSYKRATEMGIDVQQIWISTLDGRTRHEHRKLMGQKRPIGKPFEIDGYELMFPGDPTAKPFLVYNCRCTLIGDVDGAGYDLENRIKQHLAEKDLTWDEWIKEQPLPRHYNESLKDYLKRYKVHHQKMKFSDWMEEQAMPDTLITQNWADKKMSNIYNMIKEQNVTDANKFYKELGKLGKPSIVWDKYLTGQLDAEDLKSFEEILKKYLPKEGPINAIDGFKILSGNESDEFLKKYHNKSLVGKKGKNTMDGKTASDINNSLRNGEEITNQKYIELMEKLDKGINSNAIPEDMIVYRGISSDSFMKSGDFADFPASGTIEEQLKWAEKKIGKTVSDKGYLQTSASMERSYSQFQDVGLLIKAKKGTNAYISDYLDESEIIFAKNSKLKITEARIETVTGQYGQSAKQLRLICEFDESAEKAIKETVSETADSFAEFKKKLPEFPSLLSEDLQKKLTDLNLYGKYALWMDETISVKVPELDKFFKEYQQQVSKKITDLEKQIEYNKSEPMSFEDADSKHVNPNYKGNHGIYSVNCQTCAFTYEARRQGYNVVALGKDPSHSHTYALQQELAKDQSNGWINKLTGEKPDKLICPKGKKTPGKYNWLEETVGHNGERYTLSVAWKSGGAHVVNMDRDANGVLRLIDNQRGLNEKHIWTGEEEIKHYLDSVKFIKYALRVDDCIPNPKYLNMVTKEAKSPAPKPNEKTLDVLGKKYTKSDLMDMDEDTLIDTLSLAGYSEEFLEKFDGPNFKKDVLNEIFKEKPAVANEIVLDKSQFANKKMSAVYTDIKKTDVKTANQFYKELQKMGKPSEVWDKYLKGELPDVDVQKIEKHLQKKYSALDEAMPGESVTGLDIDTLSKKKVTGVYNDFVADGDKTTANKFYNELKKIAKEKGYGKQSDVWKKYLNGELDFDDIEKIDKYVIKKYTTTTTPTPGIEPEVKIDYDKLPIGAHAIYTKLEKDVSLSTADDFTVALADIIHAHGTSHVDVWEKYKKQQLSKEEMKTLDDFIGQLDEYTVKTTPSTAADITFTKPTSLTDAYEDIIDKLGQDYGTDFYEALKEIKSHYSTLPALDNVWVKYLNDDLTKEETDILDGFMKKLNNPYSTMSVSDMINDPGISNGVGVYAANESAKIGLGWKDYIQKWANGDIKDEFLDEKLLGIKPVKPAAPKIDKSTLPKDYDQMLDKLMLTSEGDDLADKISQHIFKLNSNEKVYWDEYIKGNIEDSELDKLVQDIDKHISNATVSTIKTKADLPDDMTYLDLDQFDAVKAHIKSIGYSSKSDITSYYTSYKHGNIDDPELDKIFGIKPSEPEVKIDYDKLESVDPGDILDELQSEIGPDESDELYYALKDITIKYSLSGSTYAWEKYVKQELTESEMKKIDELIGKLDGYTIKVSSPTPNVSKTGAIDYDKLPANDVAEVYAKILNDFGDTEAKKFLQALIDISNKHTISQIDIWEKYAKQQLPKEDMELLDDIVSKLDEYTIKPASSTTPDIKIDYDKLPDQWVMVWNSLDDVAGSDFNDLLIDFANLHGWYKKDVWEQYIKQKLPKDEMKQLDDIVGTLNKYHVASTINMTDDLKKTLIYFTDEIKDEDLVNKIWKKNMKLSTKYGTNVNDVWQKYWAGEINEPELDKLVKQAGVEPPKPKVVTSTSTPDIKIDYDKLPDKANEVYAALDANKQADFFSTLDDLQDSLGIYIDDVWTKYIKQELLPDEMKLIDDIVGTLDKYTVKSTVSSPAGKVVVDYDKLAKKKVTEVYNEIKNDTTNKYSAGSFYNELKKIGKDKGIGKQGDVWNKYLLGQLDPEDMAKIDKYVIWKYNKVEEPTVPVVDIDAIKNKKMSQFYNELKAESTSNANKFYNELKKHGKPSEVWNEYLKGELPEETTKKIDEYVIKKYSKGVKASAAQKQQDQIIKTASGVDIHDLSKLAKDDKDLYNEVFNVLHGMKGSPGTNWKKYLTGKLDDPELDEILVKHNLASDNIVKKVEQQKELNAAKKELEKAKAALPPNETYSGIWKDDVSLSDYAAKKNAIAAKKAYFEDELQKAKDLTNQNPHQPGTTQYNNYISWNENQIIKFETLLDDLDEFEKLGKEYEKAQKAVDAAQKKVNDLTPTGFTPDAYTKERKDAALWAKTTKTADDHLRDKCGEVWRNASKIEKDAIYEYTSSYHKFNEPLRGIEYGNSQYKGVGKTDLNARHANNGEYLNAMTDIIERSVYEEDFWLQRGVGFGGMDKFLNVDMNLLRSGSEKELQNALLGTTPIEYGFMSAGVAKGKGFSGSILFNVYAPRGTKMMYAEPFSAFGRGSGRSWNGISTQSTFGGESEIILQQGTKFRITKIEKRGGQIYMDLEVIEQLEPQRWKK